MNISCTIVASLIATALLITCNALQNEKSLSMFDVKDPGSMSIQDLDQVKAPPFSNFNQMTKDMYHTSVGGINGSNLIKYKIGCIFDLAFEVNYTLPKDSGVEHHIYHYVRDRADQNLETFLGDIVSKMETCVRNGKKIVVHCVAGASRSGTAVIAFLIKHEDMSLKQAFIHARTRRSIVRPNNGFMKQLIHFEEKIRGTTSVKMVTLRREVEEPDFFEDKYPEIVDADFTKSAIISAAIGQRSVAVTLFTLLFSLLFEICVLKHN